MTGVLDIFNMVLPMPYFVVTARSADGGVSNITASALFQYVFPLIKTPELERLVNAAIEANKAVTWAYNNGGAMDKELAHMLELDRAFITVVAREMSGAARCEIFFPFGRSLMIAGKESAARYDLCATLVSPEMYRKCKGVPESLNRTENNLFSKLAAYTECSAARPGLEVRILSVSRQKRKGVGKI